jgi:Tfp pilus assembly protein PilN
MIEINLLPQELKSKAKKTGVDYTYLTFAACILIFAIVILLHLCLFLFTGIRSYQVGRINSKLHKLEPQREAVQDFKAGYDMAAQDAATVRQLAAQRIIWSEKLNKLSLNITYGIWFNEISVSPEGNFSLSGSVVSLETSKVGSINLINKFIDNLKKDSGFFKDFDKLEPPSTKTRMVGEYDIRDFTLTGQLKIK